jgi:hypothetical protein
VPEILEDLNNEKVRDFILELGYDLNPMKGIDGDFYTINRLKDLHELCREIIKDRNNGPMV